MARVKGFISTEAVLALIIVSFGVTLYYDSVSQLFNKKESSIETLKHYFAAKKKLHSSEVNETNENFTIESMSNEPFLIKKSFSRGRIKIELVERRK